jgi:hypothetical protein
VQELSELYSFNPNNAVDFLQDRHMTSKTFTKQNLVVLCNHNALHKNVQVFFEYIPPTKELLVKLLLVICLSFYSMYCILGLIIFIACEFAVIIAEQGFINSDK